MKKKCIVSELSFFKRIEKNAPIEKSEKIQKTTILDDKIFELTAKVEK